MRQTAATKMTHAKSNAHEPRLRVLHPVMNILLLSYDGLSQRETETPKVETPLGVTRAHQDSQSGEDT